MKKAINICASVLLFGVLGVIFGYGAYFAYIISSFSSLDVGSVFLNIALSIVPCLLIVALVYAPYVITLVLTVKYLKGDLKRRGKIALLALSSLWCFIFFVMYAVLVSLMNINYMGKIYVTILIPIIFVVAVAALVFNNIKLKKTFFFSMLSLALVFVISYVSVHAYYIYQDKIMLNNLDAIDTSQYLAFDENSKIARLEEEASLKFSEDDHLPVVDGAAALFPLYSAFVNATYPSSIPELNARDDQTGETVSPYTYFNTITGYERLIEGKCDVMFAAAPSEQQVKKAAENDVEFELIPIGLESFIFFVNEQNPIDSLTVEQVKSIYSGRITNWKELGGKKEKVVAYQRNEGSGSQTALINFMGDTPLYDSPPEIIHTMAGFIERVAYRNNKGAIGFSFRYYAESIVANGNIKILKLDGVEASVENIKNGTYPISVPFYMVVRKGERTDELNRLIEWVLSEEGQSLVEKSGYVSIN